MNLAHRRNINNVLVVRKLRMNIELSFTRWKATVASASNHLIKTGFQCGLLYTIIIL